MAYETPRLTREDVIWAYRLLLNRDPESDAVIESQRGSEGRSTLVRNILLSPEFRKGALFKNVDGMERPYPTIPVDAPKIVVETAISKSIFKELWDRVYNDWSYLGETRPHFSVFTNPEFLPGAIDDNAHKFWDSGKQELESIEAIIAANCAKKPKMETCVEYGCGVGRLTYHLAAKFKNVIAYDISPGHIRLAQERASALGLHNITFVDVSKSRELSLARSDFFYSRIVFQHNPPPVIAFLIRAMAKSMNEGGLALFQVPTYHVGYHFEAKAYLQNRKEQEDMEMHCLPQSQIFTILAKEGGDLLLVREDNSTENPDAYISNMFLVQKKAPKYG